MSKPHIDLMNRGAGSESLDYEKRPVKELLSTCPCDSCLDLYRKIHGKDSPMEYRVPGIDTLPVPAPSTDVVYNAWVCPKSQAQPPAEIAELIRRAPWVPGKIYHSVDGITPDIDESGNFYLPGSIHHHLKQFTDIQK